MHFPEEIQNVIVVCNLILSQIKVGELRKLLELSAVCDLRDQVVRKVKRLDLNEPLQAFNDSDLVV